MVRRCLAAALVSLVMVAGLASIQAALAADYQIYGEPYNLTPSANPGNLKYFWFGDRHSKQDMYDAGNPAQDLVMNPLPYGATFDAVSLRCKFVKTGSLQKGPCSAKLSLYKWDGSLTNTLQAANLIASTGPYGGNGTFDWEWWTLTLPAAQTWWQCPVGPGDGDVQPYYLQGYVLALTDIVAGGTNPPGLGGAVVLAARNDHGADWGNMTFTKADGSTKEYQQYNIMLHAVPEPTSMLVLGTGLIGLAGCLNRRRK